MRIEARDGGVRFAVHVQPRASQTGLAGSHGDAVKIRLQAPPVDDAANEMLVDFVSERFAVARRNVRIVSGTHSRAKVVEVDGFSVDDARRILTLQDK